MLLTKNIIWEKEKKSIRRTRFLYVSVIFCVCLCQISEFVLSLLAWICLFSCHLFIYRNENLKGITNTMANLLFIRKGKTILLLLRSICISYVFFETGPQMHQWWHSSSSSIFTKITESIHQEKHTYLVCLPFSTFKTKQNVKY